MAFYVLNEDKARFRYWHRTRRTDSLREGRNQTISNKL